MSPPSQEKVEIPFPKSRIGLFRNAITSELAGLVSDTGDP